MVSFNAQTYIIYIRGRFFSLYCTNKKVTENVKVEVDVHKMVLHLN